MVMQMHPTGSVRWEMEVQRVAKLGIYGIRLRRTGGDHWLYKEMCQRLMQQMRL